MASRRKKILLTIYAACVPALWVLSMAVYCLVICATLFFASLQLPSKYKVDVFIGEEKDRADLTYEIKESEIFENDRLYVNFTVISDLCLFPVSGDNGQLKYKIENGEGTPDYMTVYLEKGAVSINSQLVSIQGGIIVREQNVYLPAEFINSYFEGISIKSSDEEKTVEILVLKKRQLKLKDDKANEKIDISQL